MRRLFRIFSKMSRTALPSGSLGFRGNEFQEVFNAAIQDRADSGENINVQPCDFVVAIVVDLGALHFSTMAELVLTDACLLNQFIQLNSNGTVFLHAVTPLSSKMVELSIGESC